MKRAMFTKKMTYVHSPIRVLNLMRTNLQYIVIHRVQPATQRGYLLVAHTAFKRGSRDRGHSEYEIPLHCPINHWRIVVDPIRLRRTRSRFILGASIEVNPCEPKQDDRVLRGLPTKLVDVSSVAVSQGHDHEGPFTEIVPPEFFPPGSILLFETRGESHDPDLEGLCSRGAQEAFECLSLVELNCVLYRSDEE